MALTYFYVIHFDIRLFFLNSWKLKMIFKWCENFCYERSFLVLSHVRSKVDVVYVAAGGRNRRLPLPEPDGPFRHPVQHAAVGRRVVRLALGLNYRSCLPHNRTLPSSPPSGSVIAVNVQKLLEWVKILTYEGLFIFLQRELLFIPVMVISDLCICEKKIQKKHRINNHSCSGVFY